MEWRHYVTKELLTLTRFLFISIIFTCLFSVDYNDDFANAQTTNTTTPTYTIGVLFPDPAIVREEDPTLNDMIVASNAAINMASENIIRTNLLPGTNRRTDEQTNEQTNTNKNKNKNGNSL